MIDPTKIDMNAVPKKFADGALGTFSKEYFAVALTMGNALDAYALTPTLMKSIATWMNSQVATYEKQYGEIDMTPPQIYSPIQISDLQNPGDN
jgi:hypothetical protein